MNRLDSILDSSGSGSEAGSFGKSSRSGDSFHAPRDEEPQGGASSGVSVHAGFPNPAADRRLRGLDLNELLVERPSSTFIFRIRGQEGTTQGIFDGDIAVVDRAASPRPMDYILWHDGAGFKLSRPSRVTEGAVQWGVITAVIHQYRAKEA